MGDTLKQEATAGLEDIERGSLMDVGCGRGEMLDVAEGLGFDPVQGCEIVPALCDGDRVFRIKTAASLPWIDRRFDVVTCFDVLEHVDPSQSERVVSELWRITKKVLVVHLNLFPANPGSEQFETHLGEWGSKDLHINLLVPEKWKGIFDGVFRGQAAVTCSWIEEPRGWFRIEAVRREA